MTSHLNQPVGNVSWLERFANRLDTRRTALKRTSQQFSRLRLVIFITGSALTLGANWSGHTGLAWLVAGAFTVVFVIIAYLHDRVIKSIKRHRTYATIKREHIARIHRDWASIPAPTYTAADEGHPFASDLDLAGPRSLHHLTDTAVTREGSSRLLEWLMDTCPDKEKTLSRQRLVNELTPLAAFRDRLVLLNRGVASVASDQWSGDVLIKWLEHHADTARMLPLLVLLCTLNILTVSLLASLYLFDIPSWWLAPFMVYVTIYLMNYRLYAHLFEEAEHLYDRLTRLRPILLFLERFHFVGRETLSRLCEVFQRPGRRPSTYVRRVTRLAAAASTQKSDILTLVLNVLMPWDLLFSYVLTRYKHRLSDTLPEWLEALKQLEAAGSLATLAYLNDRMTFPRLSDSGESHLVSTRLGHPLLAESVKVRNDFQIRDTGRIALVTGSNMSGKSTFLRTLGLNLSLAFAGGPVDANVFESTTYRLFTCINVSDSVNDGISYFYAEVKRLKALLDASRRPADAPLFYLIDEIFRGTNNRERFEGSRALLHSLINEYATGVVSTHDLELVHLEEETDRVKNYHFRETVLGGRMEFDYCLREGASPTTNALKIMALEGLPVG